MNILFHAINHGYDEGYETTIYQKDDKLYQHIIGNNLIGGDFDETYEISQEEALEIMFEEVENEDTDYLGGIIHS